MLATSLDPAFASFVAEVGLHCEEYTGTGSYCE